jgi:hypothetical protein
VRVLLFFFSTTCRVDALGVHPCCRVPTTILMSVVDGDFFWAHRLSTNFAFLPRTVAKPPSPSRALAYAEGGVILGPHADPEGWKVFDTVTITGTLFKAREVSVDFTVGDFFATLLWATELGDAYSACGSDPRASMISLRPT